jgi:rubrerythrin
MENETRMGLNRTGIQMSPIEGPDQARFALAQPAHPEGSIQGMAAARAAYIVDSPRIGSVPMPSTGKGLLQTTMGKMTGKNPEVLLDKLGQRLAFERSGVRLYQAMITKVETAGDARGLELRTDLMRICAEEARHFRMLEGVIRDMGADPTAQTPAADVSGVAGLGLLQVVTDPRTTIAQSLEAILTAELTDNACWELLAELAAEAGQNELVAPFQQALQAEQEHLAMIKRWLRDAVLGAAR